MPCRPSAPILGQRSRGKTLLRSISAARGAISLAENAATVSRMASAVSPRSKLNIFCALGVMTGLPADLAWLLEPLARPRAIVTGFDTVPYRLCRSRLNYALAAGRAAGCNSLKHYRRPPHRSWTARSHHGRSRMHGTIDHAGED